MDLNQFRLERYFAEYEFSARYLLCSSDCESMGLGDLLAFEPDSHEQFSSLWLGYTEAPGNPELRQEIARLYEGMKKDHILVHSGAEEAIFNFMNVSLKPGDHIIVHAPYYQSLGEVAMGIGASVTEWLGNPELGWELDLQFLKDALTPLTKVVVVNFPHNPTGFLPAPGFIQELAELSDKHGFVIFSDEVYRGLEFDESHRLPAIADINERAVSLGVMSKTYGLAGLRIGWIATKNSGLYNRLETFKDYTTICNSAPGEFLSILALRHGDKIIDRNLNIIQDNLKLLDSFFNNNDGMFTWHRPRAGSIAFPELLQGDIHAFCHDLVKKTGVLLLPGTLYGSDYNSFRIGFGRKSMPEALNQFEGYLQSAR